MITVLIYPTHVQSCVGDFYRHTELQLGDHKEIYVYSFLFLQLVVGGQSKGHITDEQQYGETAVWSSSVSIDLLLG